MADYTWDYLLTYSVGAENWLESEPAHVAVLTARAMHAERIVANEAADTAPVDPAPVDPTPTKKGK